MCQNLRPSSANLLLIAVNQRLFIPLYFVITILPYIDKGGIIGILYKITVEYNMYIRVNYIHVIFMKIYIDMESKKLKVSFFNNALRKYIIA